MSPFDGRVRRLVEESTKGKTMVTQDMVDCWRVNYALDHLTPENAMRFWAENHGGWAPAGAVAALGLMLEEREQLRTALKLAVGALSMLSPCAAPECKAEQLEWLQAARQAAESALTPNV